MNKNTIAWLEWALDVANETEVSADLIVFTIDQIDALLDSVSQDEQDTYLLVIEELEGMLEHN